MFDVTRNHQSWHIACTNESLDDHVMVPVVLLTYSPAYTLDIYIALHDVLQMPACSYLWLQLT
jgi:hypothetical protein